MVVIKSCTGVFLRHNNLDHIICNTKKLEDYSNGDVVSASFVRSESCASDLVITCPTPHNHPTADGRYLLRSIK